MSRIQDAVNFAVGIAYDDRHGYSQDNRGGPDYDCSSLMIQSWENAGVPVKSNGATYTGNMYEVFIRCGFTDVTSRVNTSNGVGLQYGDVLLNDVHHTAMYIGNNQIVHASINEKGTAHGGQTGDQTGREICVRSYYNYPWNHILRFQEDEMQPVQPNPDTIDWEAVGRFVCACGQQEANDFVGHDFIQVDGVVGEQTRRMAIRVIQHAMNLDYNAGLVEDGIWGSRTSSALGNHYIKKGETQYMVTCAEILALLHKKNPNGVEKPGIYGNGLAQAYNTDYISREGFLFTLGLLGCRVW